MVHGTGFHGRLNAPLAARLSEFHAWAPDLRGHGDSTLPDVDFDWHSFSEDLEAVLETISPEEPVFGFAHSMGATASLLLEGRRPGTFRALYCYEPIVIPAQVATITAEQQKRFRETVRKRRRSFASPAAAYDRYSSKPPFSEFERPSLEAYIEHGFDTLDDSSIRLKMHPDDEVRVFQMNRLENAFEVLPTIECPIVVARGREDPGPPTWASLVASHLHNATLEAHDHLGHMGPYEDGERISGDMRRFFRTVVPGE